MPVKHGKFPMHFCKPYDYHYYSKNYYDHMSFWWRNMPDYYEYHWTDGVFCST